MSFKIKRKYYHYINISFLFLLCIVFFKLLSQLRENTIYFSKSDVICLSESASRVYKTDFTIPVYSSGMTCQGVNDGQYHAGHGTMQDVIDLKITHYIDLGYIQGSYKGFGKISFSN